VKFNLDSRLENDSIFICDLPLSQLRLINDAQIIDLSEEQQMQLWKESASLSHAMRAGFSPDKLNVAAIGNIVAQLHMHHICRFKNDVAWPAPVWGRQAMIAYSEHEKDILITRLKKIFSEQGML
jgi:diadenosine tetraphosphate (Ap4A) HIT family hydrolase